MGNPDGDMIEYFARLKSTDWRSIQTYVRWAYHKGDYHVTHRKLSSQIKVLSQSPEKWHTLARAVSKRRRQIVRERDIAGERARRNPHDKEAALDYQRKTRALDKRARDWLKGNM